MPRKNPAGPRSPVKISMKILNTFVVMLNSYDGIAKVKIAAHRNIQNDFSGKKTDFDRHLADDDCCNESHRSRHRRRGMNGGHP